MTSRLRMAIQARHTAEIIYRPRAWWFKYSVHRLYGIGIPENGCTLHHSFKRAARAKARWEAKDFEPRPFEIS